MTWQDWALIAAAAGGVAGVVRMFVAIPQWYEAYKARKLKEKDHEND